MIYFRFLRKKNISDKENILYSTEVDKTVVIASVFYFSIVDKQAKIICIGSSRRSIANQEAANVLNVCCCGFTGTV